MQIIEQISNSIGMPVGLLIVIIAALLLLVLVYVLNKWLAPISEGEVYRFSVFSMVLAASVITVIKWKFHGFDFGPLTFLF